MHDPPIFLKHCATVQAYLSAGSFGAERSSRSDKVFLADAPIVSCCIPVSLGASPADAVPHSWHLAAGLAPMFIAHYESRHALSDCLEQGAAAPAGAQSTEHRAQSTDKSFIGFFIFSLFADSSIKGKKLKAKIVLVISVSD